MDYSYNHNFILHAWKRVAHTMRRSLNIPSCVCMVHISCGTTCGSIGHAWRERGSMRGYSTHSYAMLGISHVAIPHNMPFICITQ